jgi:hypothetical protein|eukprot:COSAG01_NODE_200_length_22187_cov_59.140529_4_plen_51_part_00
MLLAVCRCCGRSGLADTSPLDMYGPTTQVELLSLLDSGLVKRWVQRISGS